LCGLLLPAPPAHGQPTSFPTEWTSLGTDPDEGGASNDFRDVQQAFFAVQEGYLFLRMKTLAPTGWPSTRVQDDSRLKWFFDTTGDDGVVQGGNALGAEYMLFVEDLTLNSADPTPTAPTPTRDQLGELTLLDDLTDQDFAEWEADNPPLYTTNGLGSGTWRREVGARNPGVGGPQSVLGADIGYRIGGTGRYVCQLVAAGNPSELNLIWSVDQMNNNLNQAPNSDRQDDGLGIPIVTTGSSHDRQDRQAHQRASLGPPIQGTSTRQTWRGQYDVYRARVSPNVAETPIG
jgi:hypothetical protein